jgi:hypothetical protein
MKCILHLESDASSACTDCGAGLCTVCAQRFDLPLCDQCNIKRLEADRTQIRKSTILTVICLVLGLTVAAGADSSEVNLLERFLIAVFVAGFPLGWVATKKHFGANSFLAHPQYGWLIWLFIYLAPRIIASIVLAPFAIVMRIIGIARSRNRARAVEESISDSASN